MFWRSRGKLRQAELGKLKDDIEMQRGYINALMEATTLLQRQENARNRRVDAQLREIYQRLDRMEGIR